MNCSNCNSTPSFQVCPLGPLSLLPVIFHRPHVTLQRLGAAGCHQLHMAEFNATTISFLFFFFFDIRLLVENDLDSHSGKGHWLWGSGRDLLPSTGFADLNLSKSAIHFTWPNFSTVLTIRYFRLFRHPMRIWQTQSRFPLCRVLSHVRTSSKFCDASIF